MNTYKVIKIEGTIIYLGKDDGALLKIEQTSFDFVPQIGDIVEVYKSEEVYIITKKSSEVLTENKEVYWTVERIKSVAWAGVFAIVTLHNLFIIIPSIMVKLLRDKGEYESSKLITIVAVFTFVIATTIRVLLTGSPI
jgi:hypothetical protein